MTFLDFARLVRLPNVFTAMADICMGAIVTGALPERLGPFIALLLSSTCLYWAGMVWNDYFDIEQDKRERPFRPLASGRVSVASARALGIILLSLGLIFATAAGAYVIAALLTSAIILYDCILKRTWAGPIAMGTCRFLNVLLGLSVTGQALGGWGVALALAVGVYIVGVTWFARTEALVSNQTALLVGAVLMLAGLLCGLAVPSLAQSSGQAADSAFLFPYLLAIFGFYVGSAVVRAVQRPVPQRVQAAVKRAVLGLIILDAVLATALAGLVGLMLLALLVPARFLGRWVYST